MDRRERDVVGIVAWPNGFALARYDGRPGTFCGKRAGHVDYGTAGDWVHGVDKREFFSCFSKKSYRTTKMDYGFSTRNP